MNSDIKSNLPTIAHHAAIIFGDQPMSMTESSGAQGVSGATVRYFEAVFGSQKKKFIAKHATLLERQSFDLLGAQGQAIPRYSSSLENTDRDWLVMEHLDAIPYGSNHTEKWAKELGRSLAKIHAVNMGKRPDWLPELTREDPLLLVYATEWKDDFNKTLQASTEFKELYGSLLPELEKSWIDFKKDVDEELATPQNLTLINPDFAPDHYLQKEDKIVFIDWEASCFGIPYFDLPNMFNHETARHYYDQLVKEGVDISQDEFSKKFVSLSRYLGFRFMVVGLSQWRNSLDKSLPDDYWQRNGEKFFHTCLDVAQNGHPAPVFR